MSAVDLTPLRVAFEAMSCGCEVVAHSHDTGRAQLKAAVGAAVLEVQRIEHKFSRYRPDSVVSRINAAAGQQAVECDAETLQLLQYAQRQWHDTRGLFDITSGVLRRVWNFRLSKVPTREEVEACLPLVDGSAIELGEETVRLPRAGMEIDLGGFGKEYAADRAAAVLGQHGLVSAYVNLGGDFRVLGPKPDGSAWQIGIQHPRQRDRLLAAVPLTRGGLATSGDYERFIEINGRRHAHILHPRTGWPVSHWQSITVIAPMAIQAGQLATTAMLMESQGLQFLHDTELPFIAVDATGAVHTHQDRCTTPAMQPS